MGQGSPARFGQGPARDADGLGLALGGGGTEAVYYVRVPEIDGRLDTTDQMADFTRQGVDVAIRFGQGRYPELEALRLFDEVIYPVCSPALLARGPKLETPADLAGHTLLHVEWSRQQDETLDWRLWLQAAGRLVHPFKVTLPVSFAYYLVYPRETTNRPKIAAFREWILAEAAR